MPHQKTAKIKKWRYCFAAVDISAIGMSKGLSQFFICAVLVRYAVKWCDKLRFCIYYSITTNTNIKINHSKLWNCRGPLTSGGPRPRQWKQQPPHRYAAELDRAARVLIYCLPDGVTGVNTAGDAGDTSPPIFWLVGTSMGISPPIFLRTFGYSRQFIPYISRSMFDKADFLRP